MFSGLFWGLKFVYTLCSKVYAKPEKSDRSVKVTQFLAAFLQNYISAKNYYHSYFAIKSEIIMHSTNTVLSSAKSTYHTRTMHGVVTN